MDIIDDIQVEEEIDENGSIQILTYDELIEMNNFNEEFLPTDNSTYSFFWTDLSQINEDDIPY